MATYSLAQVQANDILGIYWTDTKEGKIEIYKQDEKFYGKILWRKEARKDIENPDASFRDRSVIGIVFLSDFSFDGYDEWEGGKSTLSTMVAHIAGSYG